MKLSKRSLFSPFSITSNRNRAPERRKGLQSPTLHIPTRRIAGYFGAAFGALLLLWLAACTPQNSGSLSSPTRTPTFAGTLTPYSTRTPTISLPSLTAAAVPTRLPTATSTPRLYKIKQGDDMYGIAFQFGVSPQMLMTANPKVNPRAMVIGAELAIPEIPPPPGEPSPTPTLLPPVVIRRGPDCYPSGDGLFCYLLVENQGAAPLENVTGLVRLTFSDSAQPVDLPAVMPLNLLLPGKQLPLAAYLPSRSDAPSSAAGEVLSGLPVSPQDERYFSTEIRDLRIEISPDGRAARVTGQAAPSGSPPAGLAVWVTAAAYSETGQVVGVRKWESSAAALTFSLDVYSLGPRIYTVDVQAETRRN